MGPSLDYFKKSLEEDIGPSLDAFRKSLEPTPERGPAGDVVSHLARGTVQAVGQVGGMISEMGAPKVGDTVYDWAEKKKRDSAFLQPDASELAGTEGMIKKGFMEAVESTPASAIPFLVGTAATIAAGPIAGAAAGSAALLGTFGLGTFHQSKVQANQFLAENRPDLTPEERDQLSFTKGWKDATLEAGTEFIGDAFMMLTFGGGKAFKQPLKKTLKALLSPESFAKAYLKDAPVETSTEMLSSWGQAHVAQDIGMPTPAPLGAAGQAILPSLFMSLGFGGAIHGYSALQAKALLGGLNAADPATRKQAAGEVAKNLLAVAPDDQPIALKWFADAHDKIKKGEKIDIDARLADFAEQKLGEEEIPSPQDEVAAKRWQDEELVRRGVLTPDDIFSVPAISDQEAADQAKRAAIDTAIANVPAPELPPQVQTDYLLEDMGQTQEDVQAQADQRATITEEAKTLIQQAKHIARIPGLPEKRAAELLDLAQAAQGGDQGAVAVLAKQLAGVRKTPKATALEGFIAAGRSNIQKLNDLEKELGDIYGGIPTPVNETPAGGTSLTDKTQKTYDEAQSDVDAEKDKLLAKGYSLDEITNAQFHRDHPEIFPANRISPAELAGVTQAYKIRNDIDEKDRREFIGKVVKDSGLDVTEATAALDKINLLTDTHGTLAEWRVPNILSELYIHFAKKGDGPYSNELAEFRWGGTRANPVMTGRAFDKDTMTIPFNTETLGKVEAIYNAVAKNRGMRPIHLDTIVSGRAGLNVQGPTNAKAPDQGGKGEEAAGSATDYGDEGVHGATVRRAISEGKPVPPEVLADYPELAPKPVVEQAAVGDKITFIRGGREYTERVNKVLKDNTYEVYLSGRKYIAFDEVTAVRKKPARGLAETIPAGARNDPFFRLNDEQQTQTPAFQKWFGASKVVDETGAPLVVYHGSPEHFTVFDKSQAKQNTGHAASGLGHFFTTDRGLARKYAADGHGHIMPVYLSAQNPYILTLREAQSFVTRASAEKRQQALRAEGYDSIKFTVPGMGQQFIVFNSNQIKSATGNNGEFSQSPDIMERRGELTQQGIGIEATQAIADIFNTEFKNGAKIKVAKDINGVPPSVRAKMMRGGIGSVSGAYDQGTVWLIASNIRTEVEAIKTVLHESMGHHGLRALLGAQHKSFLKDVGRFMEQSRLKAIAKRYDLDLTDPEQRLLTIEEEIARMSETNEKPNLMRRIIDKIRAILRGIGMVKEWTDNDIRAILRQAQRFVDGKVRPWEGQEAMLSITEQAKAFYSKLAQVSSASFQGMKAQSVEPFLFKHGVKRAEMEATGLREWLAARNPTDKVTAEDLQNFVKANTTQLEDVVLGGAPALTKIEQIERTSLNNQEISGVNSSEDRVRLQELNAKMDASAASPPTHFSQYTEPGSVEGSYRELFVTAPVKAENPESYWERTKARTQAYADFDSGKITREERNRIIDETGPDVASIWEDGHTQYRDIENPVVRVRFNEVTDAEGRRILRVEEMQGPSAKNQKLMPAYLRDNIYQLGVKRILAYAKENGFDGVALATKPNMSAGQTQIDRYEGILRQNVDKIDWAEDSGNKVVSAYKNGSQVYWADVAPDGTIVKDQSGGAKGKPLESVIGKPITERVFASQSGTAEGNDLSVGGHGLRALYNTQLPAMFEAYGKGKMGEAKIITTNDPDMRPMAELSIDANRESPYVSTMPFISTVNATASYPMFKQRDEEWRDTSKWDIPAFEPKKQDGALLASPIGPEKSVKQYAFLTKRRKSYRPPVSSRLMQTENIDEIATAILAAGEEKISLQFLREIIVKNLPLPKDQGSNRDVYGGTIKDNILYHLPQYLAGSGIPGYSFMTGEYDDSLWEQKGIDPSVAFGAPGSKIWDGHPAGLWAVAAGKFAERPTRLVRSVMEDITGRVEEADAEWELFEHGIRQLYELSPEGRREKFTVLQGQKKDTATLFRVASLDNLEEVAKAMGSITVKARATTDTTWLDRLLSTPEYYFKKVPALGRVIQHAMNQRDVRFTKEKDILNGWNKDGKHIEDADAFLAYIQPRKKTAAYEAANGYLINTDQTGDGFSLKENGDKWQVLDPEENTVESYETEEEAVAMMVVAESAYMKDLGYSAEAIHMVKLARELTNRGFDTMAADMRQIIKDAADAGLPNPYAGDGKIDEAGRYGIYAAGKKMPLALFATEQEANRYLGIAGKLISYSVISTSKGKKDFRSGMKARAWARRHGGTVNGQKAFANLIVRQRTDTEMRPLTVQQALSQMGTLRGTYFPRQRKKGAYFLVATKPGANPIRSQGYDIPVVGNRRPSLQTLNALTPIGREARRLAKEGYAVEMRYDESPVDDVFTGSNIATSIDAILKESMVVIDKNDSMDIKMGQQLNKLITMQVADIFKARGYLASRMVRKTDDTWEGYETDMGKALASYGKGIAAGTAKRETAIAMINAFTGRDYSWKEYQQEVDKPKWENYQKIVAERGVDPRTQKNAFVDGRAYMVDILRNDEQADRAIGTLKGLAVMKFLGLRVSSAAVNATNMMTGVPATMAGHLKIPLLKAGSHITRSAVAYGQYRTGHGNAEDRAIFQEISDRGWDDAQFNHDAARELRSELGEMWNKFATVSMYMFGAVEKANRATTIFAAYKAAKETMPNADESVIWEAAKSVSDNAHGVYGKETTPAWTRGKFNLLRLPYTFLKFSHNYMLNFMDLGFTRKEYAAASYLMLSPALLAGAGATVATPVLVALAGALGLGGDDPEEEFYKWAEKNFGAEEFARHGLAGLAGVNLKGSIQVNNPMPTRLKEIFGAPGAVVTDIWGGAGHLARGEIAKGVEKILPTGLGSMSRAFREHIEGVTTGGYGQVFYGAEPLKSDSFDAALRFFSFNPARISGIREKQRNEKKVLAGYQERKRGIYAKIKRLDLQGKGLTPEILAEIVKYNERAKAAGRKDIKPITKKSVRNMLRRAKSPSKFERARAE